MKKVRKLIMLFLIVLIQVSTGIAQKPYEHGNTVPPEPLHGSFIHLGLGRYVTQKVILIEFGYQYLATWGGSLAFTASAAGVGSDGQQVLRFMPSAGFSKRGCTLFAGYSLQTANQDQSKKIEPDNIDRPFVGLTYSHDVHLHGLYLYGSGIYFGSTKASKEIPTQKSFLTFAVGVKVNIKK